MDCLWVWGGSSPPPPRPSLWQRVSEAIESLAVRLDKDTLEIAVEGGTVGGGAGMGHHHQGFQAADSGMSSASALGSQPRGTALRSQLMRMPVRMSRIPVPRRLPVIAFRWLGLRCVDISFVHCTGRETRRRVWTRRCGTCKRSAWTQC